MKNTTTTATTTTIAADLDIAEAELAAFIADHAEELEVLQAKGWNATTAVAITRHRHGHQGSSAPLPRRITNKAPHLTLFGGLPLSRRIFSNTVQGIAVAAARGERDRLEAIENIAGKGREAIRDTIAMFEPQCRESELARQACHILQSALAQA